MPFLNPEFVVHNETDSSSRVYFGIKTKELLYSKKENEENFVAKVMIQYRIYESFESREIVDSSTICLTDFCREKDCSSQAERTDLIGDFLLKPVKLKKYLLEINSTDVYRNQVTTKFLNVDKSSPNVSQNFFVKSAQTGLPLFKKHLGLNEKVIVKYNNSAGKNFLCRYYNREFPIAPPPFSAFEPAPMDFQPDSIFPLILSTDSSFAFELAKKGFYHIVADSSSKKVLSLFYFNETFPDLSSAQDLIAPLRYITSKKEFSVIDGAENKKEAIDKFWLGIGSSPERAKELIRQFYTRVQDANRFFTSFMEGWKTDRGMIYIVFGPPNVVYKSSESESWLYGEENNFMSICFNFSLAINPFSDNDFILERSPIFKTNYYKAVDTWREGRVFTIN